jgi:RHS repeat-associated protein
MELLRTFYHPDHLGSSSWITDRNAIQHFMYLPFGEDWIQQKTTTWSAPYTFSGKEKDAETGYGYFGARYYDSGLSIWLSVDPMSDKYPSLSPYTYCANNPVILVDPDGRDYETVIDEKAGTITIVAKYYTTKENKDRVQKAVDVWNGQSGKYEMVMGEGENQKKYTVNFKLTVEAEYNNNVEVGTAMECDYKSNEFRVSDNEDDYGSTDEWGNCNGTNIRVRSDASTRVDAHEIGHTLGISESLMGLMVSNQRSPLSSNNIDDTDIGAILNRAGYKNDSITPSFYKAKNHVKSTQNVRLQLKPQ